VRQSYSKPKVGRFLRHGVVRPSSLDAEVSVRKLESWMLL